MVLLLKGEVLTVVTRLIKHYCYVNPPACCCWSALHHCPPPCSNLYCSGVLAMSNVVVALHVKVKTLCTTGVKHAHVDVDEAAD